MKDKFANIISALGLGISMIFIKTCAKTEPYIAKQVDNILLKKGENVILKEGENLMAREGKNAAPISRESEIAIQRASRIIAKEYINSDSSKNNINIDNLSQNELINYFILDLSKIDDIINYIKINDTSYSSRTIRDYNWLNTYSNYNLDKYFQLAKDSSNKNLMTGSRYYIRLLIANWYLTNQITLKQAGFFNETQLKTKNRFISKMNKTVGDQKNAYKEMLIKENAESLLIYYYPYHYEIAIKAANDLINDNKNQVKL